MQKYKDSPEVRAAKKERKEKLREFLSLLDVEDMSDLRSVFKEMVGEVLCGDCLNNKLAKLIINHFKQQDVPKVFSNAFGTFYSSRKKIVRDIFIL